MPSVEEALCDTGPLVAMADRGDAAHEDCRNAFANFGGNLVTSWPVLTEAFYFLDDLFKREFLWEFLLGGGLDVADLGFDALPRMRALMTQYASLPMDVADASLVVLAERRHLSRIFTLDRRDFLLYRPGHISTFEVFP